MQEAHVAERQVAAEALQGTWNSGTFSRQVAGARLKHL